MGHQGWIFEEDDESISDSTHNADFIHQIYTAADPMYSGRVTVPVLWGKVMNIRGIADYPSLSGYVRDLFQHPGAAETVGFLHIKKHYYRSHETINPTRVVPPGPETDPWASHGCHNFNKDLLWCQSKMCQSLLQNSL